jgi:hypothetical protein
MISAQQLESSLGLIPEGAVTCCYTLAFNFGTMSKHSRRMPATMEHYATSLRLACNIFLSLDILKLIYCAACPYRLHSASERKVG